MSKPSDLVQGTLDLLILKILALEPMHGWAIGQRLRQVSSDALQVSDGSLYPALHKLEQEGWITAEWKTSDLGRRAKFYTLTRPGRRHLERESARAWEITGHVRCVEGASEADHETAFVHPILGALGGELLFAFSQVPLQRSR